MELEEYNLFYKHFHTPFNKEKEYIPFYKRSIETVIGVNVLPEKMFFFLNIDPIIISKSESIEKRYIQTYSKFEYLLERKKDFSWQVSKTTILSCFKKVYLSLIELDASNIIFDLTEDKSIFFQSKIFGNNTYLELYFDEELPNINELIANVYTPDTSVWAFGGRIDEVFEKIRIEMPKNTEQNARVEQTLLPYEELSTGSLATAAF